MTAVGVVVKFGPAQPRDGKVVHEQPPGALALESGCDAGECERAGYAWRYSRGLRCWLVVCVRCAGKPGTRP